MQAVWIALILYDKTVLLFEPTYHTHEDTTIGCISLSRKPILYIHNTTDYTEDILDEVLNLLVQWVISPVVIGPFLQVNFKLLSNCFILKELPAISIWDLV